MKYEIRLYTLILLCLVLSSCASTKTGAPPDFVVKQDTAQVRSLLDNIDTVDYTVGFAAGKSELSEHESTKLQTWLDKVLPVMIAIRGTGGAEKYRELGNNRAVTIISYIQDRELNVDMVMLDYDASLNGGRAVISVIPTHLSQQIIEQAPILIITSG